MIATVAVLSNGRQKDDTKEHVHRDSPLTSCVLEGEGQKKKATKLQEIPKASKIGERLGRRRVDCLFKG